MGDDSKIIVYSVIASMGEGSKGRVPKLPFENFLNDWVSLHVHAIWCYIRYLFDVKFVLKMYIF